MISSDFQRWVRQTLLADSTFSSAIGAQVYDRAKPDAPFPYVSFGPSDWSPEAAGGDCVTARTESLQLDVWSDDQRGKRPCKDLCDMAFALLHEQSADLPHCALVECRVVMVRIMDDPDGTTIHGVLTLEGDLDGAGYP